MQLNSFRNPTPKVTAEVPAKWKPIKTSSALEYLYIGKSKIAMEQDLLPTRIKFWNSLPLRVGPEIEGKISDEL